MLDLLLDLPGLNTASTAISRGWKWPFNRRYGLETTEAMHQSMYGKRNDQIVRGFFGHGITASEVDARGRAKEQLYRGMMAGRTEGLLVPGLRPFLDRHRDLPLAVASNAEPENVAFVLDEARLRPYLRAVVDGRQVHNPKPHPDVYLRAAELLEI